MNRFSARTKFILIIVSIALPLLWLSFVISEGYFLRETAKNNQQTLRLVVSGLRGSLLRYEPIPSLIAEKKDIVSLLSNDLRRPLPQSLNQELKQIAKDVGASDIYVMDEKGHTVIANNYDQEASFIGKNFAYRPYFTDAMEGARASFFALGTTSLKRGFYFSAPVKASGRVVGVVALKITLDGIEKNWKGTVSEIVATDKHGVVFMSSREDWLFKSLAPLSEDALLEITESKQYPLNELGALNAEITDSTLDGISRVTITEEEAGLQTSVTYVGAENLMQEAGWNLRVLTPQAEATTRAYTVAAFTLLAILFAASLTAMIFWRRAQLVKNMNLQRIAQEQLELRVSERTNDLNEANKKLKSEVSERTQAEEQLRVTQNELVQAGKLAALGQMSAALSHELNQPLAAVKSYADNAKAYLKRNNLAQAEENIGHIAQMADRMAELGAHLRNFARKPKKVVDVVDLETVLTAVDQIMSARIRETSAVLNIAKPDQQVFVKGGLVRLQQVLVNLVNNALDSMAGTKSPVVDVSVEVEEDKIQIKVRDYGSGIKEEDMNAIFDPFFTTKGVNEGLGLGLSISYNIIQDFGGSLTAENHKEGGAVFSLQLVRVIEERRAAE